MSFAASTPTGAPPTTPPSGRSICSPSSAAGAAPDRARQAAAARSLGNHSGAELRLRPTRTLSSDVREDRVVSPQTSEGSVLVVHAREDLEIARGVRAVRLSA